ncbi:MAG: FkbM family methyltransferase [Melioribacteraceae bacterium]|nr:FkbM family methyltransferase [Melioribacteraceae bacterium]MCF8263075.1 FkbM family methyltransferase [Melioribacteraceae bacterium]MCF8431223.1 FkbM family methyltransferase [Melioribacteraceae bacterium]
MLNPPTMLHNYKRNVYSQYGEDGVLEKIFEILPELDRWCVEFGAWDGSFLSNTKNLIESKNYSAVLIEGNEKKSAELKKQHSSKTNVYTINSYVGFSENDSLDEILSEIPIPKTFDLLSIDIDGNDYHVWKALKKYHPKVVVIEFNPTIQNEVRFVQAADLNINQGSSLRSIVELGGEKGYELVFVSKVNAIFVKKEFYGLFELESNSIEELRLDSDLITNLFVGFDGTVFIDGFGKLPWHGIEINQSKIQSLPGFLRTFKSNYNFMQRRLYSIFEFVKSKSA